MTHEASNDGMLHRFRTRPLVPARLLSLKKNKLREMDMGHYSAAPVVCPTITKMEHLKEVINRIKKNLPPRDGEYFYLLGNNHNHQSIQSRGYRLHPKKQTCRRRGSHQEIFNAKVSTHVDAVFVCGGVRLR